MTLSKDIDYTKATRCSRCQYIFSWALLEPRILSNQHIMMLCPSCRMDTKEPSCKENDV